MAHSSGCCLLQKPRPLSAVCRQRAASCTRGQWSSRRNCRLHVYSQMSRRELVGTTAGSLLASQITSGSVHAATGATGGSLAPSLANIDVKETVQLGKSGLQVSPVGIGAWSWGDQSGYWGFGKDYQKEDNLAAYDAIVGSGISFIDTAEVYGNGKSEEYLREAMQRSQTRAVIATKFAPLPWRFSSSNVVDACKGSLGRLGIDQLSLYMIHWPGWLINGPSNDAFVRGLADCHDMGLTQAVGVSNFKEDRMRRAQRILQDRGIPLASNQVQYSLLYRKPERNGVRKACSEGGTTLIAYSPLAQGLLTGKYTKDNLPGGPRRLTISKQRVEEVQPLLGLMRDVGSAHGGKTPAQVAINWCICKGAIPIPGAKNARQAQESAGGFGWRMSADEVAALDRESSRIPESLGAPFETW